MNTLINSFEPHIVLVVQPSLVAGTVESLPVIRETQVRSLGRDDPLEKEMATHSSILAWKIPWTEEPGRLWSMGSQMVGRRYADDTTLMAESEEELKKPLDESERGE